jgi:DNA-binding transcriptional ArsR family regulator
MPGDADIAAVAALLADPARATMLLALSDGRAFTAGELAKRAGVAPSTASEHLGRLVGSSLLAVEKQGRHRFYRLANVALVEVMEGLAYLAPQKKIHTLGESESAKAVHRARMCYNHLAGSLGVMLTEALVEKHILRPVESGFVAQGDGIDWLERFGVAGQFKKRGSLFAPWHIDWSERKHHVAGSLGAAIAFRLLDLRWIERHPASRAVYLTERGRAGMEQIFGLSLVSGMAGG